MCDWTWKIEKMNLTEQDYIDYCTRKAKEYVMNTKNIKNFGELIEFQKVSDEQLREMGSDKTLSELLKFVPRKPLNTQYIQVNFETQGTCPSCGNIVVNGMGGTNKECKKCGQILNW